MSIQLILVYKKNIKTSLESFSSERKKLKNLEYYYVTDDYKVIDLNKRKTTFNLFGNMTMGAMYVLAINFSAIYYIYLNLFSLSIHKSANAGISRIYGLFFTFQ